MMYHGFSTDWPPFTLVPASVHKSEMGISGTPVKAVYCRAYFESQQHTHTHTPLKPSITSRVTVLLSFRFISLLTPVRHNKEVNFAKQEDNILVLQNSSIPVCSKSLLLLL